MDTLGPSLQNRDLALSENDAACWQSHEVSSGGMNTTLIDTHVKNMTVEVVYLSNSSQISLVLKYEQKYHKTQKLSKQLLAYYDMNSNNNVSDFKLK